MWLTIAALHAQSAIAAGCGAGARNGPEWCARSSGAARKTLCRSGAGLEERDAPREVDRDAPVAACQSVKCPMQPEHCDRQRKAKRLSEPDVRRGRRCASTRRTPRALPLEDESVDCCVSSPPYWGLRAYSGVEPSDWGGDVGCEHEWAEPADRACSPRRHR